MKRLSEEEQRRLAAAREKARMRAMNTAFDQLRGKLQVDRGRKVPKVKTLRLAIQYIDDLRRTLHRNAQGERYDVRKAEVSAWVEQQQTINSATTSVCCFGSDDATSGTEASVNDCSRTHRCTLQFCAVPLGQS
ncbi:Protein atonal -like protein 7 [Toxocara canis]|uniref:Protein atonal-like protein 7 n=1 Tax=Toxocara canis TaxID=6265 RepID=A0A0B2V949_TOXCA|nr:Protein atonal -like protein 7 [Toxocara canis]